MLFHSNSVLRKSKIIVMECLHGKPALATTTQNGLCWYCGSKPSCQFFCPQKDRDIFARAVASFQASGSPQPVFHAHQRLAKVRVVKDNSKRNGGDTSFYARTEIIAPRFGKGEKFLRVLNRYVVMALPFVYAKSRLFLVLTKIAYFTVVPTK